MIFNSPYGQISVPLPGNPVEWDACRMILRYLCLCSHAGLCTVTHQVPVVLTASEEPSYCHYSER